MTAGIDIFQPIGTYVLRFSVTPYDFMVIVDIIIYNGNVYLYCTYNLN